MTTQDDEKTESNLIPTENNKKKKKEKKSKPLEVFKFNNIDSGAYAALYRENPQIRTCIVFRKPMGSVSKEE